MIVGRVLAGGEAVVKVKVRGLGGQMANVEAMIDTGFNDEFTLPPWVVAKLGLEFQYESTYSLADGAESVARIFKAELEWMGSWREISVAEVDRDPLVGMLLMLGCHLGIDVVENGNIEISPLGSA